MIDIEEFLLQFSVISLVLYFLRRLKKKICMSLSSRSKQYSSSGSPHPWLNTFLVDKGSVISSKRVANSKRQVICSSDFPQEKQNISEEKKDNIIDQEATDGGEGTGSPTTMETSAMTESNYIPRTIKPSIMSRKRPAQLVLPPGQYGSTSDFAQTGKELERKEVHLEGRGYSLACKKGKREVMEDGHGITLDISGNPKQAFFVVTDGHGGRAAADFVAENLGKNILNQMISLDENMGNQIETAIRRGYSITDNQFLSQGLSGGACAASVLVKDGELYVANAGDCRVVLSRKGVATALTSDHRLCREDERARIENSGGYLHCRNGIWRVNGSLAVSRAFGDFYLKEYVISEPEIIKLPLTSDCEFLIMASDGLWDKVGEQEAVDVVSRSKNSLESCKELVDITSTRGNIDDVTVMVINLQSFVNCND